MTLIALLDVCLHLRVFCPFQDLIVISGYERNVEEARQAIQQLVTELQEMVSQEVHLDPRTHARIIGARGKAIRKLMEEFKVRCLFLCF